MGVTDSPSGTNNSKKDSRIGWIIGVSVLGAIVLVLSAIVLRRRCAGLHRCDLLFCNCADGFFLGGGGACVQHRKAKRPGLPARRC
jgi:hypothetical protein